LWSTVAFNYVEFYALTFVQSFETVALDCGEMYEYIVAAFNFDEAETFFSVKPFYCTCLHVRYLQKLNLHDFLYSEDNIR